jgi:DMSO/TMAO reductase YedYZ heme-binding membrane subunit
VADVLEGPLAATSIAGAIRRLGVTRWQRLRRLVYVIMP